MKTLKIAVLSCFLVVSVFANKKLATLGSTISERSATKIFEVGSTIKTDQTIKVMTLIEHRVKNGQNITKILRRYNVTPAEFYRVNPSFTFRDPNLIYPDEIIIIPLYQLEKLQIRNSPALALISTQYVALTPAEFDTLAQTTTQKDRQIYELQKSFDSQSILLSIFSKISLVSILLLVGAYFFLRAESRELKDTKAALANLKNNLPKEPQSSEDFVELLRSADGQVLSSLLDLPIIKDEVGNSVSTKNVAGFLAKRPYLIGVPVKDWPEAMAYYSRSQSSHY